VTWEVAKVTLKKIWLWFRVYWPIPAILLYTAAMWVAFRRNSSAATEVLNITKESYEKQVAILEETHKQEIEQREKNSKRYDEAIKLAEEAYEDSSQELTKFKKKRIKQLVEEHQDDPARMSEMLGIMFGITYVETVDDNNN